MDQQGCLHVLTCSTSLRGDFQSESKWVKTKCCLQSNKHACRNTLMQLPGENRKWIQHTPQTPHTHPQTLHDSLRTHTHTHKPGHALTGFASPLFSLFPDSMEFQQAQTHSRSLICDPVNYCRIMRSVRAEPNSPVQICSLKLKKRICISSRMSATGTWCLHTQWYKPTHVAQ